jgi:hypothetical protein
MCKVRANSRKVDLPLFSLISFCLTDAVGVELTGCDSAQADFAGCSGMRGKLCRPFREPMRKKA